MLIIVSSDMKKYKSITRKNRRISFMEAKKYRTSKFQRIVSIGIMRYGAKIDGDTLYIYHLTLRPIKVNIKEISDIYYGVTTTPVYAIKLHNGNTIGVPMSFFEARVYQQLLKDLKAINDDIKFDEEIIKFLEEDFSTKKSLRFDFEVHKGGLFQKDFKQWQKNPSVNVGIGFLNVFFVFFLPVIFGFVGYSLLSSIRAGSVDSINVVFIVLSGLSLGIMLSNIASALLSMYFGHKVTTIAAIVSVVLLVLGFMQF